MARNRKRRSDRRPHRPADGARSQPGIATASASRRGEPDDLRREEAPDALEAPDPIEHAAPDVELAEAQLALGRPGVAEEPDEEDLAVENSLVPAAAPAAAPVPATRPGNRLVHFLQGSWRELQRVQWPDRRQVMQATGVVIGFVIVAGVFLGVADLVANKLVQFLLK